MNERDVQSAISQYILAAGVVREEAVLFNDYRTPQVQSVQLAPYVVWDAADSVALDMSAALDMPAVTYTLSITLLDFARGRSEKEFYDSFQSNRDDLIRAFAEYGINTMRLRLARAASAIEPFYEDDGRGDVATLAQRFELVILEVTL